MVRTAVIGLGRAAAEIHLPACRMLPEIEVVAGCDPDEARRMALARQFGLPAVYADPVEMLAREQPELVIVGVPPAHHSRMAQLALEHGAHVLCEKPFVGSLDEADCLIETAMQQRRLLAVNNQYRYMDIYRQTKAKLLEGVYGPLFYVQAWQQMFHPPSVEQTPWRRALPRYTLFEFGTHPLDLICHFFDALPLAVNAIASPARAGDGADVLVQMTLYFPDERYAVLSLNRMSHAPERYLEMRLDCERASLRLSYGGVARAGLSLNRTQDGYRPDLRFSLVKGGEARAESGGRSARIAAARRPPLAQATARHLIALLPEMQQPQPSLARARWAREILRIVFAGYESAARRQVVMLAPDA